MANYINNPELDTIEAKQLRALVQVLNKRDNYLLNRIIELQDALAAMKRSTGDAGPLRDAIPANFLPSQVRPRNDAIQDIIDDIDAGLADI